MIGGVGGGTEHTKKYKEGLGYEIIFPFACARDVAVVVVI